MKIKTIMLYFYSVIFIRIVEGSVPGTFFWRPRVGIEIFDPKFTTAAAASTTVAFTEEDNIVLIDGFALAKSFNIFTTALDVAAMYEYQNPFKAAYYNNVYRWLLRCLENFPSWLSLESHYIETHKVWKSRYEHMDEFVPNWLRSVLFFVDKSEWKKDEERHRRYKKYAEDIFAVHYNYEVNLNKDRPSNKLRSKMASKFSFDVPEIP